MVHDTNTKQLVKILIAAAWVDGKLQPEEQTYLQQIATEKGVATDPEIQSLLNQLKSVQPTDCNDWIKEYLGEHPTTEAQQNLIEAISGLIYRDGEVATAEARLLTQLQSIDTADNSPQSGYNSVLKEVQKLYRRWINQGSLG